MIFDVDESVRKRAKTPHELSMVNLVGCHLIAAPASIVLDIGFLGFLIPLLLSLSVIGFIWYRAGVKTAAADWFVTAHWRLSANRTRILIIGYTISALILGMAMLATSGSSARARVKPVRVTSRNAGSAVVKGMPGAAVVSNATNRLTAQRIRAPGVLNAVRDMGFSLSGAGGGRCHRGRSARRGPSGRRVVPIPVAGGDAGG